MLPMSSELRIKKLRGSGGYVMARVTDEQQSKGNLGGPDLFLAPIGRLDADMISKHFCNACEREFESSPRIESENPNEEVAENLILVEKGQYICNECNGTLAEYREFKKQDELREIGDAKPLQPDDTSGSTAQVSEQGAAGVAPPPQTTPPPPPPEPTPQTTPPQSEPLFEEEPQPRSDAPISPIEGRMVYDENANKIGIARQVGIDSVQLMVLAITKNDGTEASIPWDRIKKVGEVILLGNPDKDGSCQSDPQPGKCSSCGFTNKEDSKFCEECGTKI